MRNIIVMCALALAFVGCATGPSNESMQVATSLFVEPECTDIQSTPISVVATAVDEFFSAGERQVMLDALSDDRIRSAYSEVLRTDSREGRETLRILVQQKNACEVFAKLGSEGFQTLLMRKNVERLNAMFNDEQRENSK